MPMPTNSMRPYLVVQGDYLDKIAALHGFDPNAVWSDAKNDDLRAKRKDPNQLAPGDILYIPDPKKKWAPLTIGQTNTFACRQARVKVTLQFSFGGQPLANERYTLDDAPSPKTTDGAGSIACEVPVTATSVRVHFVDRREVHVARVGHLDPVDEQSGVRQRLAALGIFGRAQGSPLIADAVSDDELAEGLRAFQRQQGLPVTGAPDDETRAKLVDLFGA